MNRSPVFFSLVSILVLGCGGSSEPHGDAGTSPAASACDAMFGSFVQRFSDCDGRPLDFGLASTYGVAVFGAMASDNAYDCARVADSVSHGKIKFTASALATCQQDIAAMTCNAIEWPIVTLPPSCNALFAGTVADKGSCDLSQECENGTCDNSSTCPGTCSGTITVEMTCTDGSICTTDQTCGPTGSCIPRKTSGTCNGSADCAGGYQCTQAGGSGASTCLPYIAVGAACTVGSGQCAPGAACIAGTCAAWPAVGGTCGNIGGEQVGCLDAVCNATATMAGYGATGTCIARLARGAACTVPASGADPCEAGNTCVDGKCAEQDCYY